MVRNRKETTEKSKKKLGISTQIYIALLAGALLVFVFHYCFLFFFIITFRFCLERREIRWCHWYSWEFLRD